VSPRLASETLATAPGSQANAQSVSTNNLVNFDILADYRPLPLDTSGQDKKVRAEKTSAAMEGQSTP
jgi:hypothetical protein